MKLAELAARLDCRLDGDGDVEITRVAGIHEARPGDVTFLANRKYEKALANTLASAVIAREGAPAAPCAMLRAPDPYLAFARAGRATVSSVHQFGPIGRGGVRIATLDAAVDMMRQAL